MNGLVGYGSSDSEEDIRPEKPAKIARVEEPARSSILAESLDGRFSLIKYRLRSQLINRAAPTAHPEAHIETQRLKASSLQATPTTALPESEPTTSAPLLSSDAPAQGPAAGPTIEPAKSSSEPPLSPHTTNTARLRELTMPFVPNFEIPSSPSPPPQTSEEAANLAAVTKQFSRFLELKGQGVHFNARLQNSDSLRNPSLLPKLMEFAGISAGDSYASTLPEDLGLPVQWPEECYVEGLLKTNERKEKKRLAEREKVDFVPPAKPANEDGGSSGASGRKSKFDRR